MPNELVYGTLSRSLPQVCPISPLFHASYIMACNTGNVPLSHASYIMACNTSKVSLVHYPMLPTLWHVILAMSH